MYSRVLISLGWLGILAGIGYFVISDRSTTEAEAAPHVRRTQQILIVSGAAVATGYLLRILGKAFKTGASKCSKCGKKIDPGEMFCFDHRQQAIWDAKERHRIDGGGPIRNRPTKN